MKISVPNNWKAGTRWLASAFSLASSGRSVLWIELLRSKVSPQLRISSMCGGALLLPVMPCVRFWRRSPLYTPWNVLIHVNGMRQSAATTSREEAFFDFAFWCFGMTMMMLMIIMAMIIVGWQCNVRRTVWHIENLPDWLIWHRLVDAAVCNNSHELRDDVIVLSCGNYSKLNHKIATLLVSNWTSQQNSFLIDTEGT